MLARFSTSVMLCLGESDVGRSESNSYRLGGRSESNSYKGEFAHKVLNNTQYFNSFKSVSLMHNWEFK